MTKPTQEFDNTGIEVNNKMTTKDFILQEIRRTAKENNDIPLGWNRFTKETGIGKYDWLGKYWTKWSDAIIEAGYNPNNMQSAYDRDDLIMKIISFIREIGKFPTPSELRFKAFNSKEFPSANTFRNRLGNKEDLISNIIAFCGKQSEYSDIVEICNKAKGLAQRNENQSSNQKAQDSYGCVYLMKSGRYYKIGRSNHPGRRNYELDSILPQNVNIIHVINTDDPVRIEAYWHDRFKDKRVKNEWFDLSNDDISVFKKRKFM